MSAQATFFHARAAEARSDADQATLTNVRDRCLRAEAAWSAMASRADRAERTRDQLAAAKSAELI
jgi:hypothetical protein